MSIDLMSMVFQREFGTVSKKVIALKLADHADDFGCGIWPSAGSIAAECDVSTPTARRVIKDFVKQGLLKLVRQGGNGRFDTNRYDMDLAILEQIPLHEIAKKRHEKREAAKIKVITVTTLEGGLGDHGDRLGSHGDSLGDHGDHQTISKPLDNSQDAQARGREDSDSGIEEKKKAKAIETAFKSFAPTWPSWVDDSEPNARKAWIALEDYERDQAAARCDDYLQASKIGGRTKTCALAKYLSEKRWLKLDEPKADADQPMILKTYGKDWMAHRLLLLAQDRRKWLPTAFQRHMLTEKKAHLLIRERHAGEFPLVARMDDDAALGRNVHLRPGTTLPDTTLPDTTGYIAIQQGSPEWDAWEAWHEAMDYPFINPAGEGRFVWFPSAIPEIIPSPETQNEEHANG